MTSIAHDTPHHMEEDTHNYDPIWHELEQEGYDLPEMGHNMEDAEARMIANRLLKVLGSLNAESDANKDEFKVTRDFFLNRHVARENTIEKQVDWVTFKIKYMFDTFMTVPHGKKSLNLLSGRVGVKKQPDELVIEDDQVVIDWANGQPGHKWVLRIKEEVSRTALRKWLSSSESKSIVVPGVSMKERDPKFYATPATD